jgi:hypothetical protein
MRTGRGEESATDHVRFRNTEALYISEPADKLEALHHVYAHAATKWARVSTRHIADVKHRCAEKSHDLYVISAVLLTTHNASPCPDLVIARFVFHDQSVLRNEVVVRHLHSLWQARCSTAKKSRDRCVFASLLIVPRCPIALAVAEQGSPARESIPSFLVAPIFALCFARIPRLHEWCVIVENKDVIVWYVGL